MKPVMQTTLGGDSAMPGVRGDCLRASVASIFERDIEDVPHFVAEEDWWGALNSWVEAQGFVLGTAFVRYEDDDPTVLTGYPNEEIVWLATVKSPRLVRDDGKPGLHSVVMQGKYLIHDPHPGPKRGEHLGFVSGYTFIAPDPARLRLREV